MTTPTALTELPRRSSVLHLRPVPRVDGPYDDERHEPVPPMVDGALALAFPPPTRTSVPLRLVPPAGGVSVTTEPTKRDLLPDPRPWTARLAQAIAEVLAGARPAGQLSRVATLDVLQLLERGAGRLGARPGAPPQRPIVGSVHLSEPRDGVAEACAVVDTGPRKRALALRLEGIDGQWRCTALQIG
ncbi:MAG TPA: Rv3235 family protein [Mycobacteriales bacterium]|jgi:hypothetical protein|nr:Rv3235 family protein [Mycobacteriales bacterium]